MSVMLFGADDLGNVAAFLACTQFRTEEMVRSLVEDLAAYSVGNTWAFNRQYREQREPVSVADILKATNLRRFNREQARTTLHLLAYNGATNAGTEIALAGYFEALTRILSSGVGRLLEERREG